MGVGNKTVKLTGWPGGVNNVSTETAVPLDELRQAVNVDLTVEGKPRRRQGYTQRNATMHSSLWASTAYLFAVRGGNLVAYAPDLTATTLVDGVLEDVSFEEHEGVVYWTDNVRIGRIVLADLSVEDVWIATPDQPIATPSASGGLPAGRYQVAITFIAADGRESGSNLATIVNVPEGGGVALASIPTNAAAALVRVYLSGQNGAVLYQAVDLAAGTTDAVIGYGARGRQLETQFCQPLPAGAHLALHNGRLYVAVDNAQMWSQPFAHGLHHPDGEAAHDSTITMQAPCGEASDGSMFVSTLHRTYFVKGADPSNWQLSIAYMHGAVPRTLTYVPGVMVGLPEGGDVPLWYSKNGFFCYGTPDGRVVPMTEGRFVGPVNAEAGAVLLREENGLRQLALALLGGSVATMGSFDSAEVTITRRHGVST